MLFWSFILAFVVGILYYVSMPYDMIRIEQKPMADTAVVMFVNAHQRAKEMIYTIENAGNRDVVIEKPELDEDGRVTDRGGYKDVTNVTAPTIIMMYDDWMRGVIQKDIDPTLTVETGIFCEKPTDGMDETDFCGKPINLGLMKNGYRNIALKRIVSSTAQNDLDNIYSFVARVGTIALEKTVMDPLTSEKETTTKNVSNRMLFDCVDYDDTVTGNTGCKCDYKKQCTDGTVCSDDTHCSHVLEADKTCVYRSVCRLNGNRMDTNATITDNINNTTEQCVCTTKDYVITYMNPDNAGWNEQIVHQELWRSAILRRTKGSHECGVLYPAAGMQRNNIKVVPRIARKYDLNAEYVLDNSQRFTVSIPKLITDEIKKYTGETDLTDYLFCITPIDDIRTELSGGSDGKKGGVFHRKGYIIKESKD